MRREARGKVEKANLERGRGKGSSGIAWLIGAGTVLFAALYLISRRNYLLFHAVAEVFSSMVAFVIFVVAWHTRRSTDNGFLAFLGVSYLFVGAFDILHMLAYSGMGVFEGRGADLATQLWIIARYLEAGSLLAAPLFLSRRLNAYLDAAVYAALSALALASIFIWDVFPACFVDGYGLTPFKVGSEYVICAMLAGAAGFLYARREELDPRVLILVIASIGVTVSSELSFTLYRDPYAFPNFLGHFLKIVSFYLLYRAIVETGLEKPFDLLFRRLRDRERRERAILDASAEAILLCDASGAVLAANQAASQRLGKDPEELRGAGIGDILPEGEREGALEDLGRAVAAGAARRRELRRGERWFERELRPVPADEGGEPLAVLFERDITEQREALEVEKRAKERWQRSFDAIGDAMLVIDGKFRIIQHNDALCKLLGEEGDFTGRTCYELIHGLEAPPDFCVCARALEKGSRARKEVYEPRLGKHLWISLFPVFDRRGGFEFGVHVIQDVSDRVRMEEALRESEEKFRSVVEQSADGILLVDGEGRIVEWNSALEDILGVKAHDALGRYLWDVQHELSLPERRTPGGYEEIKSAVVQALERGYETWFGETSERELQTPAGERRIVQAVNFPIRARGGLMVGSVIRDVTRRVRMEETLAWESEVNRSMAELSGALLAQASLEDVSQVVLENAKRLTRSPYGYVGYIDSDTGYLISPTLTRDVWGECGMEEKSVVFKEFKGLWGWVLRNRQPLLTNDAAADPRSTGVPEGHIPIERFLSVPALLGGALVGQVAVANSERDYDHRDLEVLGRLADLYAMAVLRMWSEAELDRYRKNLEDMVRERTRELERVNRMLEEEIEERGRRQEELRVTTERLRALTARLESIREEERRHISREVHDTLGQALTGLKINLSLLGKRLSERPDLLREVEGMAEVVDSTIKAVREIAASLRPGILDDLGLEAALEWQLKRFGDLYGIECRLRSGLGEGTKRGLGRNHSTALFRIAQEALTNVARHAEASRAEMWLREGDGWVEMELRDDGRGITMEEAADPGSLGILGMRERANFFGGEVQVTGAPGGGTIVLVRMPLERREEARGEEPGEGRET
ncbi:MAG: PAS domain S-box protein [Actinobacteria bacterium]|nr:PAS domain S-box protein [Actinomycetota bacterium]